MNLAFFLSSILLTLTVQSVQVDTGTWQARQPEQYQNGETTAVEPMKSTPADSARVPFHGDEVDPSGEKPLNLPMILAEKSREEKKEEPVPTERVMPRELPREMPRTMLREAPREISPNESGVPRQAPEKIARTSHEVTAPRELAVTSSDLEQLIKDSIAVPQQDGRISGRSLRLLDALSVSSAMPQPQPRMNQPLSGYGRQPVQASFSSQVFFRDPREEQRRVNAYWQLAQSLGQYNLTQQLLSFWESVSSQPGDEALLRTARSSARALLCETRVTLVSDQHSLVEAAGLAADQELPLPSDPPHVGTYFTHFDKLFAGKPVPALGRRLDATLPLYREAVESRACSTLSARNATELLTKEYAAGRCTFAKLAAAVDQWREEQRAFIRVAYVYNYNICEYVVSVAGLPADRGTLVTMLIRPTYPVTPEILLQPTSEVPVANGQMPTLAPPLRDPAVRPASVELPILQYVPRTPTTPPLRRQNVFRLFPVK